MPRVYERLAFSRGWTQDPLLLFFFLMSSRSRWKVDAEFGFTSEICSLVNYVMISRDNFWTWWPHWSLLLSIASHLWCTIDVISPFSGFLLKINWRNCIRVPILYPRTAVSLAEIQLNYFPFYDYWLNRNGGFQMPVHSAEFQSHFGPWSKLNTWNAVTLLQCINNVWLAEASLIHFVFMPRKSIERGRWLVWANLLSLITMAINFDYQLV